MATTGRPTLCTPEVIEEVCKWLASGCYVDTACELAGICRATYYNWKQLGEAGGQPYLDFLEAITRAEHKAEARAVALITKAGEEDPRALQWWLTHRHAARWADTSKHEVTGSGGGPVAVEHSTTEAIGAFLEGLVSAADADETEGAAGDVPGPDEGAA